MDKPSTRQQIWGEHSAAIEAALQKLDPDLAQLIIEVAYENVFARGQLDLKTRELLAITALLSVGSERELRTHMRGALNCGASLEDIKETLIQAAMYLGFPKALMGMKVLQQLRDAET